MSRDPWRDTRDSAAGNARAGRQPDSAAELWEIGVAVARAQAAAAQADCWTCPRCDKCRPCGECTCLGAPDPASPLGRRHAYDTARQVWDSARATCVECGADCGVSVDHCGRCGYPVCRACAPLVLTDAGDVTVTCAQCRETGSL